jgi:hypothetical protein
VRALALGAVLALAVGCTRGGLPETSACTLDDEPAACVVERDAARFSVTALRGVVRLELLAAAQATADPPHIEITDAAGSCVSAAGGAVWGVEDDAWCIRYYFTCGGAAAVWQRHAVCMAAALAPVAPLTD